MRFKAFHIRNFRSIIDSRWNNLSNDNITALIGQNESGKTSVLEALYCYYQGVVTEDMLRSDNKMPVVSCSFDVSGGEIISYLDKNRIPEDLAQALRKLDSIILTREWINLSRSSLSVSSNDILEYYGHKSAKNKQEHIDLSRKVNGILKNWNDLIDKKTDTYNYISKLEIELKNNKSTEKKLLKKVKRARKTDDKLAYQSDIEKLEKKKAENAGILEKKTAEYQEILAEMENKQNMARCAEQYITAQKNLEDARIANKAVLEELVQIENTLSQSVKGIFPKGGKLEELTRKYEVLNENEASLYKKSEINKLITEKMLAGTSPELAENEAECEYEKDALNYSMEELAMELFKQIPSFEFFEDFSSLLPNRIEVDDLLHGNIHAEGYKAARNFLKIAGLNDEFFKQTSSRLLKQKIEDMNRMITLNFQEYWRQSIGKDNKISLCFELEHYDFTHPEKSGKPYIEFWIMDKNDRLYPKQRSRGVRWFLSFFLELKANASEGANQQVVLIDEPGLSLHARAQEDVLKVFEDIKDNIHILYSTHSPHLIDINKTYRLLAVQRASEEDDLSGSIIMDSRSLTEASADTLSPIYTLMGTRLNDQQFIQKSNNVIVEDITTYYYLTTIFKMAGYKEEINILPATDVKNVITLANLLMGWKLNFMIILNDTEEAKEVWNNLKTLFFFNSEQAMNRKVLVMEGLRSIEDVFSTIDFKKHVLNKKIGITERNSEFIEENNLSRPVLAANFMNIVQIKNLTIDSFDEETRAGLKTIINNIINMLSKVGEMVKQ
ncbi:MAG: AAA family ATPase [Bacteroidales bacterium]|nr:AAA family ATPase [Bacteroidales bacterium]